MKIAIRVDASNQIGTGHFMRCLTLAEALKQRGGRIRFISRHLPDHLRSMLEKQGHEFIQLNGNPFEITSGDLAHSHWLGTSQHEDVQDSISALSDQVWDWLVVDHYALDRRWHQELRPAVGQIMVIDDLADRDHDCDLLLDQNLADDMVCRYIGRTPVTCRGLLGPHYALLQPMYAKLHAATLPRQGPVRRILLFFGGADRDQLTERALRAVQQLDRPDIKVNVVVGAASPDLEHISALAAQHPHINVHCAQPSLAPLLLEVDLAVGTGGATCWERLCLGLPCIVVTVADNQRPVTKLLAERGLVNWLGDAEQVSVADLLNALTRWCDDGIAADWFPDYQALVDGHGVTRVCEALLGHSVPSIEERTPYA